jgi:mannose-6-phosphate isomerase-like protein (cupin superfamily)
MTLAHGGGMLVRVAEAEKLALPANVTTLFVEGAQTNGAFSAIRATLDAGAEGARPHHHTKATELFFVIAGAIDVLARDRVLTAGAGDVAVVPPGAMHAFANASATAPADMLIVFGPGIERFDYFRLLREVVAGMKPGAEILASQERFDNWFGESEPWKAHLAQRRGG